MSAIIDLIIDLLSECCVEFRLFLVTLGIGLGASQYWQFDTDKPVFTTFAVLLMLLFAGIFLYRRFSGRPDHEEGVNTSSSGDL